MNLSTTVKLRIPATLHDRIEAAAARSARKKSDLLREGLVIGLEALSRRIPDDDAPRAA